MSIRLKIILIVLPLVVALLLVLYVLLGTFMDSFTVMGWSLLALNRNEEAYNQARKALEIAPYDQRLVQIAGEAPVLRPSEMRQIGIRSVDLGEKRFVAGFGIDANKRLTLSLKDLLPGNRSCVQLASGERMSLPIKNMPFVKL